MREVLMAQAPSNIAWIKYMGKKPGLLQWAENSSVSLTLSDLQTRVLITPLSLEEAEPLSRESSFRSSSYFFWDAPQASEKAQERLKNHSLLVREQAGPWLEKRWGLKQQPSSFFQSDRPRFRLVTQNTFPEASGIASSASSFAALTLAFSALGCEDPRAFQKLWENPDFEEQQKLRRGLSQFARLASGSASRSLEGPWVLWEGEEARKLGGEEVHPLFHPDQLTHFVLLAASREFQKAVHSSEAHQRVRSSTEWPGRGVRAEKRLKEFLGGLRGGEWEALAELVWNEAWDLHGLFHTARPPWTYWTEGTWMRLRTLLQLPGKFSASVKRPWVTLDAGPHVHVLVPRGDAFHWREFWKEQGWEFLEDIPGLGATLSFEEK